jgi:hypothetical protein
MEMAPHRPTGAPAVRRHWIARVLYGPSRGSTAAGICGLIVTASVLAASARSKSVAAVVADVVVAVLVYWAADAYAEALAGHMHETQRFSIALVRESFDERWRLVRASYTPLVVMVAFRLFGSSISSAVLAGLLCATALLAALGWHARPDAPLRSRVGASIVTGAFGLVTVALKLLLHH